MDSSKHTLYNEAMHIMSWLNSFKLGTKHCVADLNACVHQPPSALPLPTWTLKESEHQAAANTRRCRGEQNIPPPENFTKEMFAARAFSQASTRRNFRLPWINFQRRVSVKEWHFSCADKRGGGGLENRSPSLLLSIVFPSFVHADC